MSAEFHHLFRGLCERSGHQVAVDDEADEHARLAVYRSVAEDSRRLDDLLACIVHDPDPVMASDVLVSLLERVHADVRQVVVDAAPPGSRHFVAQRADEVGQLELLSSGDPGEVALQRLVDGSDWLQRRAAERSESAVVLGHLRDGGRTRKVRAEADHRLRTEVR